MQGVNKTFLIGHVGQDPTMRYLADGSPIANFTLATSESRKDKETGEKVEKVEWHRLAAFGKLAEIVQTYVKKGSLLYIEGKNSTSTYDKDGQKHYSTQVIVQVMQMLGGKTEGSTQEKPARESTAGGARGTNDFEDDIPFAAVRSYP